MLGVYFISLITGANAFQNHRKSKDKKLVTVGTGVKHRYIKM